MIWKLSADALVALHAAWVLAAALGPLWAWRRPGARAVHLALLWITALVEFSGYYCPLTLAETSLRMHHDPSTAYAEGFVAHWLDRIAGIEVGTALLAAVIAGWTLLWTGIYAALWRRERQAARESK